MTEEVHGVVLAGGVASRMGFPKALAPVEGSCFLQVVWGRLNGAGVAPVHIVANTGLLPALEPLTRDAMPGAVLVPNAEPERGQIRSLQLGLAAARAAGAGAALIALVDQPWIQSSTVQRLVSAFRGAPECISLLRYRGRTGHPYLVPAGCFAGFLDASPGVTAKQILQSRPDLIRYVEVEDPGILRDADSLADWPAPSVGTKPEAT